MRDSRTRSLVEQRRRFTDRNILARVSDSDGDSSVNLASNTTISNSSTEHRLPRWR